MDINQVKKDFDDGILICKRTVGEVIERSLELEKAVASLNQAQPQWFKLDDQLPECGTRVLVLFHPFADIEREQTIGACNYGEYGWTNDDGYTHHTPSHWMPLPALPQGA